MAKTKAEEMLGKWKIGEIFCRNIPCYECPVKTICETHGRTNSPYEELAEEMLKEVQ